MANCFLFGRFSLFFFSTFLYDNVIAIRCISKSEINEICIDIAIGIWYLNWYRDWDWDWNWNRRLGGG